MRGGTFLPLLSQGCLMEWSSDPDYVLSVWEYVYQYGFKVPTLVWCA